MQYSPPPLFKQGASARAKVVFFSAFAIFLLVVDTRLNSLVLLRQIVGTLLYPVQVAAVAPRNALARMSEYFVSTSALEKENVSLKLQQISNADVLQQSSQLRAENTHLRTMLELRHRLDTKSVLAEIIYDARDQIGRAHV